MTGLDAPADAPLPGRIPGEDFYLSFAGIAGKRIVDVHGFVSRPFESYGPPVFSCSKLVFEDGTELHFEGEHDIAYLTAYRGGAMPDLTPYADPPDE